MILVADNYITVTKGYKMWLLLTRYFQSTTISTGLVDLKTSLR